MAKRHGITVRSLAVDIGYIHVVATTPPTISVSKALQLFKGISSWAIQRAQPTFHLRYPHDHIWDIGGGFRSIGDVDA